MRKRFILSLLLISLLLSSFAGAASGAGTVLWGDVNGDGRIAANDILILRHYLAALGYSSNASSLVLAPGADCDGSGTVSYADLSLLCRFFANLDFRTEVSSVTLGPGQETEAKTETGTETSAPLPTDSPHDYSKLVPTADQMMIIYEPNGGQLGSAIRNKTSVSDSATKKIVVTNAGDYFYQTVNDSVYLCPHSMGDKNYLSRPGYVLYGYNTAPDGSGEYFGCGWNVPITKGERTVLFAMWAKESDASLFSFSGGKIVSYKGNEDTVVVPASINGNAVTEISARAFSGKDVRTVILPKSIVRLNAESFHNCQKLSAVYMFDLITSMPETTFAFCPNMTTLFINNANSIKYVGAQKEGMYHLKFQRLLLNRDQKKIVIVSGSNSVYGISSPIIESELGGEYTVINYGTNFYVPSALYIEAVSHFLKKDDILLITPEEVPQQWGNTGTNGKNQFMPALEGCMELISYLDIRNYTVWLPVLASMNEKRSGGTQSYESQYGEAVDSYGEFSYERTTQAAKFGNTSTDDWFGPKIRQNCFTAANIANLNRSFDLCTEKGAKVYISFSVCDKSSVTDTSAANLKAYEDAAAEAFVKGRSGRAVISHVSTYLFDHSCFYNSMHHLLSEPAKQRSLLLAADIKAQLEHES